MDYCRMQEAMIEFVKENGLQNLVQCLSGALYDRLNEEKAPQDFPAYELKRAISDAQTVKYQIERALKVKEPKKEAA